VVYAHRDYEQETGPFEGHNISIQVAHFRASAGWKMSSEKTSHFQRAWREACHLRGLVSTCKTVQCQPRIPQFEQNLEPLD
jgi:hypothetical protein